MGTEAQPGKIACPHCQALIKAPALPPGSSVNCPKCSQEFKLGHLSAATVRVSRPNIQGQGPESRSQTPETDGRESVARVPRQPTSRVPVPPPPPPPRPQSTQSSVASALPQQREAAPRPTATQPSNPESKTEKPKSPKPDNLVDPN